MTTRPVHRYDPPAAAIPDSSKYLAAMTYRASREAKALRVQRWWAALVVISLAWGGVMTWDNRRLTAQLVEVARHKPVYRLDELASGHQRLVLLDDTLTVTKGTRLNAVAWFVRWTRAIGTDPVALARDRAAARARLTDGAERKWDGLLAADLDPGEGWTRDVADLALEEREHDPATGLSSFHVVWAETVYRDFKPVERSLMAAAVVTRDGMSRDGALDGVSITGFSEPAATALPLPVTRRAPSLGAGPPVATPTDPGGLP
ncbi:hypothetical protein [Rhodocista pekingensis]|uniref:Uncharacterized protein n=1 Tax=Rhodocista pekingensis TaxID=201185 RepID=A0ABW2KXN0_9PROT